MCLTYIWETVILTETLSRIFHFPCFWTINKLSTNKR